MTRDALRMRLRWTAARRPPAADLPAGVAMREVAEADGPALGSLMWAAFAGTVDDDYATPSEAMDEAVATLAGAWGPVQWHESLAAETASGMVGAAIVVLDPDRGSRPLLAFAMIDPAWQGRGIGQRLIEECVARLNAAGFDELHLAVTRQNPALRLYERLGFQVVAPATGWRTEAGWNRHCGDCVQAV